MHRCSIEWLDYVWNPITGCLNSCEYCSARKQSLQQCGDRRLNMSSAKRWKDTEIFYLEKPFGARSGRSLAFPYGYAPTCHEYRMDNLTRRKVGARILVGSMGEMFGDWVPDELIEDYEPYRYRQQKTDATTAEFLEYVAAEPLIKCILAGHLHVDYDSTFAGRPQRISGGSVARVVEFC